MRQGEMISIPANLIRARCALGITTTELAKRVGVCPATVCLLEESERATRCTTANKIAAALEMESVFDGFYIRKDVK